MNEIKEYLYLLFSQFKEYERNIKNNFNAMTTKLKKDVKNTVDKYTSLIIVLILLYFLKDFLMLLLVKFDKLSNKWIQL